MTRIRTAALLSALLGAGAAEKLPELISWCDHADPRIRYFSGRATYTKQFDRDEAKHSAERVLLSFGEVKNLAEVELNGVSSPSCGSRLSSVT